jgi:predicted AlkP superfamily phosphohydrolase/phosphomutase
VNLNTWLVQNGFMALQGQAPGEKKLQDLFGGGTFWENVDWSRTKAYAMGLGQIYVNLKGREGHGIVEPGQQSSELQDALVAQLMTMADPNTATRWSKRSINQPTCIRVNTSGMRRNCRSASQTATAFRGNRPSAVHRPGWCIPT